MTIAGASTDVFALMAGSTSAIALPKTAIGTGTSQFVSKVVSTSVPVTGPTFSKPLSTPDPIPESGRNRAMELMESGALFRYQPGVASEVAQVESDMCEYTGFKYTVSSLTLSHFNPSAQ